MAAPAARRGGVDMGPPCCESPSPGIAAAERRRTRFPSGYLQAGGPAYTGCPAGGDRRPPPVPHPRMTPRLLWLLLLAAGCGAPAPQAPAGKAAAQPRYTEAGELRRPEGYADWVLVGSALGLGYSEGARREEPGDFHHVFLSPPAYAEYERTGTFPEKTMLALVLHEARQGESIARRGY